MKRLFDILLSLCFLLLLSPVMLVISVLILLFDGRPIFFIHTRPGLNGKLFNLYKFRTMSDMVNVDGTQKPDDERLTDFGKYLRRTSLDELPQLINVIKGDLSIVGPRPLLTEYLDLYSEEQARRHNVRPGITGWAQVNGRNDIPWEKRLEMDVWYVDNHNFLLDIKILLLTLVKVISGKGVSQQGKGTVDKFKGNN